MRKVRNPVRIGEHLRVDYKNINKRNSSLRNAKYFYITYDGELILMDEFPKVNANLERKFELVQEFILVAQELMAEIREEEYYDEVEEQELKEELDLSEELYRDLLVLISKVDPEFFEEIIEEEHGDEDAELEEEFELADKMYQDLLDILHKQDSDLFLEITRPTSPRPSGSRVTEEKIIYSVNLHQEGHVFQDRFFFDKQELINTEDLDTVINFFDDVYAPMLREMFQNRPPGKDDFMIPAILMQMQTSARKHKIQGISSSRAEAHNLWEFEKLVIEPLRKKLFKSYQGYIKASFNGQLSQIGIALETMNRI